MTLNVALTGNVAAGKSLVAALFREWGATLIDADVLARAAQEPGTPGLAAIAARFGPEMIGPGGALDRVRLRSVVLADPAARADLEGIIHPEVHRQREALMTAARARADRIVVNDIPLLFEVMDPAAFDAVVLVDAPEPVRLERLVARRGLDPRTAAAMIAAQLPSGPKRARSDYVIDNDGDIPALRRSAADAWQRLVERAAEGAAPHA